MSSLCIVNACFAPLPADGCGTELAADGAAEVSELVWLWGEDSVVLVELDGSVVELCVSVGCVIVGTNTSGAVTGTVGIAGTDMIGDTGLVGFVGFDNDFTQVFEDVTHEPPTGFPYGFGQVLVDVWTMLPVYPA
jgi:hypothetical protein